MSAAVDPCWRRVIAVARLPRTMRATMTSCVGGASGCKRHMTQLRAWCSATMAGVLRAQCKADDLGAIKEAIRRRPSLLSDRVGEYGGTLLHEACR